MRKFFAAAIAAAFAVSGFAVIAIADDGPQGTSWTHALTNKRSAKPTGSKNDVRPAKVDDKGTEDTSDDRYVPPAVTVVRYAKGASIDPGALPKCKASPSAVQAGNAECPNKTRLHTSRELANVANSVVGQSDSSAGTEVLAPIRAYNAPKKSIMFVVDPCNPGPPQTGPGTGNPCQPIPATRVVLLGKWSKLNRLPTLRVETPPQLLQGGVIITRFRLATRKVTRKVRTRINGRRRTVVRSYVTTPRVCKGSWKTQAVMTYQDGSKVKVRDAHACRKNA